MKRLYFIALFFLMLAKLDAQVPQALNYQAVARNQQGNVLANKSIAVQVSILNDNLEVYRETHQATTNQFGLFMLQVGKGSVKAGTFATIDWGAGSKLMKIGIDQTGGTTFTDMGTSPILTVPFAMVAAKALNVADQSLAGLKDVDTSGKAQGNALGWDGTKWKPLTGVAQQGWQLNGGDLTNANPSGKVGIGVTTPQAKLHLEGADNENVLGFKGSKFISSRSNGSEFGIPTSGEGLYLTSQSGSYKQAYYFADASAVDTSPVFGIVAASGASGLWNPSFNVSHTGLLGIGVYKPKAKLHIHDGGLLLEGAAGDVAIKGAGTRLIWVPEKKAFRCGEAISNEWDKDKIGKYSLGAGYSTLASGDYSLAIGNGNRALGPSSVALGANTSASGTTSVAIGSGARAEGNYSTALGLNTVAKAFGSTVIGNFNDTIGQGSSTNLNFANRIFEIGNGSPTSRSNAMVVYQNGNTTINGTLTVRDGINADLNLNNKAFVLLGGFGTTTITGDGTRLMWLPQKGAFRTGYAKGKNWDNDSTGLFSFCSGEGTKATGKNALALGYNTIASGYNSVALGDGSYSLQDYAVSFGSDNRATGQISTAFGWATIASGQTSTSWGQNTVSSGLLSTATGYATRASGGSSFTMGDHTVARTNNLLAIGTFNDSTSGNSLFIVGNGTADANRSNAMSVLQTGNVGIGVNDPQSNLSVKGAANIDQGDKNDGTIAYGLKFGSNSGEGIGSRRTSGSNKYGLDFYTNSTNRMSITNLGDVAVVNMLTVKNGKGIIRCTDATQKKIVNASATVNQNLASGATATMAITWSEAFATAPVAYVGNSSGSGFAEVTMSLGNVTATGATLYIYNSRATAYAVNYSVNLIAIGAE